MLPVLLICAAASGVGARLRRATDSRPRLLWGPVPIISIKYWSQALRARGYVSRTCVFGPYSIHERTDFDLTYADFGRWELLRPYRAFLWALANTDVLLSYFDGGFLQHTALRNLELPLLRLAGKRIIVSPYGSDIAVPGYLGVAEAPLLRDYPEIATRGPRVRRRVLEFTRCADLVVRNYQYGYLPRWDVTWPTQIAIDIERWQSRVVPGNADGHADEVVIVHAPNHRHIKGTKGLLDAVAQLRQEGLRVRLEVLEHVPNAEVRERLQSADIVADQFIAGYALFAIEGMALGRPVLSALSWMASDIRCDLEERGLPIVDTDEATLVATLRTLIEDPQRRRTLGEAGRRFVLENHSDEATGAIWQAIIEHVWRSTELPEELCRPAIATLNVPSL